jgi:hypothetical protein
VFAVHAIGAAFLVMQLDVLQSPVFKDLLFR